MENIDGRKYRLRNFGLLVAGTILFAILTAVPALADPGQFTGCLDLSKGTIDRIQAGTSPLSPCDRGDVVISFYDNSSVNALQTQVTSLQGQVISLQGNVSTLQGNVSTLQGNVSTLQGNVSTLQGQVSILQNDDNFLHNQVSILQSDDNFLHNQVSTLQAQVGTLQVQVANICRSVFVSCS